MSSGKKQKASQPAAPSTQPALTVAKGHGVGGKGGQKVCSTCGFFGFGIFRMHIGAGRGGVAMCENDEAWRAANLCVILDEAGRQLGGGKLYFKGVQALLPCERVAHVKKVAGVNAEKPEQAACLDA